MKKLFFKVMALSALLFLIVCWTAGISFYVSVWVETISYAILTLLLLKRYSQKDFKKTCIITSAVIIGHIILQLPVRIFDFNGSAISLLIMINTIISIILATLCYHKRKIYLYVLSIVTMIILNIVAHNAWIDYFISH